MEENIIEIEYPTLGVEYTIKSIYKGAGVLEIYKNGELVGFTTITSITEMMDTIDYEA